MIVYSVMSPEEQLEFAEELKELVASNKIVQSDMDIMLKEGDEIRTAIEELFVEKEENK
jgi:tRNA(Ser,Leu) C12 N-acetylase TAN1